jgi:hypothetical protein
MDHGQRSRIHRMGIRAFWFSCTYEVYTQHTKSLPRVMRTEMSRAIEGLCMVADVSGERASHWYDILPAHDMVMGVPQLCKGKNGVSLIELGSWLSHWNWPATLVKRKSITFRNI